MHDVLDTVMNKIEGKVDETHGQNDGAVVDIWKLFQHTALDIIGTTAFGQTFDMVSKESHPVPDAISEEMRWSSWVSIKGRDSSPTLLFAFT